MTSFNIDNIPDELKRRPQWICWKREERDGKPTKLPKRADTGGNAKSTDPKTWCDFNAAVSGCKKHGLDGIGFVFAGDRQIVGLDLDHVLEDGVVATDYAWIISAADTYTEISPSGDGLHLFFLGGKPKGATKCKRSQPQGRVVEMYDHDRFFTVTGNVYRDQDGHIHTEVRNGGDVLKRAYDVWLLGKQVSQAKAEPDTKMNLPVQLNDEELLQKMLSSKGGDKIKALLDGDTSGHGGDDSAADLALCNHLAFWTGGDASQMDRIFRTSGLMRSKWDEMHGSMTYGQMTIEKAIADTTERYSSDIRRTGGNFFSSKLPSFGNWVVDRGTLWRVTKKGTLQYITSTPPYIVANLRDVDTGTMRALVGMTIDGIEHEVALDRDTLLSSTKIVPALAPLGANVSTSNAGDVVSYVTECDGAVVSRTTYESVARMGWAKRPLGPFMPYDADTSNVRFDPSQDVRSKSCPFLEPKGTLEEWVAGMTPTRAGSTAFRAVLAASFASPLVALLGVQVFAVYLWGMSGSGKTPTLKAAGSVWADPTEGADSYYGTFADTPKSIVRKAAFLRDFPILLDELQSKGAANGQKGKRQAVEDLIYTLSLGHERSALNSDRTMMSWGSWHGLTIATGEIPILADNTQQGALNRTLEINAEPFTDRRAAQSMHHLVAEQHGTAGRAYIDYLKMNDADFYRTEWAAMRDTVCELAPENPQRENIALLAFADTVAEFSVFSPGIEWGDAKARSMEFALELARMTKTADERDTDRKAIAYVGDWLVSNISHFYGDVIGIADRGISAMEKYGIRERQDEGTIWYVLATAFDRAMEQGGYDRDKTLRRMRDEGITQTTGRSYLKQKRMNGGKPYCVVIDEAALYAFLENSQAMKQQGLELGVERLDTSQPARAC